ncbi:MAG TPA: tRNA epoxyqueuosine(34) reductase QueG [Tissierellales bacterium]|nr:tRNA epoxyqueuosine(34) reductase QueG [Tissierellales bacterium]
MDLKEYIMQKSEELNIDVISFTDCSPLGQVKDYIVERKNKGNQTEFEEDNINKRIDPKVTLENCKTIIVLGLSYNIDYHEKVDFKLKGSLSKSSWGIDYHLVLKEKMENLIEEIKKIKDFDYKYFVDTGPLIDREIAKNAGIGYYGKNCSIINDEYGSFIFIGYILTSLDIDFRPVEAKNHCGECTLCFKACPTGALKEPFRLNPKRCISYLTQTKDNIPYELRDKMGVKIYGCDTCQMVCPKNKDVKKGSNEYFIPRETKGCVNIEEILKMSNREFKEKYGKMAGSWRGKNILKRNGIIALGNMKKKEHIETLKSMLENEASPMIRKYAAWAILNIDKEIAKEIIRETLKNEENESVKTELYKLLKYNDIKFGN